MSIVLNKSAADAAQESIRKLYLAPSHFGIFVTKSNQTQLAFELLHNLQQFYAQPKTTSIYLYTVDHSLPVTIPVTAIFRKEQLINHKSPLVVTDYITFKESEFLTVPRLFYVHDLMLLAMLSPECIQEIQRSKIKCFGQTRDHNQVLEQHFGLSVLSESCLRCNLDTLERMIRVYE